MKKHCPYFGGVVLASLLLLSCQNLPKEIDEGTKRAKTDTLVIDRADILTSDILTESQQKALKPDEVLARLKQGNRDFQMDNLTIRNNSGRIRQASLGQYPKAVIVSCLDSRVPVEDVFHSGIGNLFVARVAGNIINDDILGSMEFGCKVSGAKVIVVLGHEYCGAVKAAIDDVKLGNITTLLKKISPAVAAAKKNFSGETTSGNEKFVEAVCDENVKLAIDQIKGRSAILKEMEALGEIKIVGGVYDMKTGAVDFFQ